MSRFWAIALTGGVACGKSEVANFLVADGIPVLDADRVAHELLTPGHAVFEAVVQAFGPSYLNDEGLVDRRRFGKLVFADAAVRERLNQLMHPAVYACIWEWLEQQRVAGQFAAVAMIPLLYETRMEDRFDRVLAVAADPERAIGRMMTRGWSAEEAKARMAAQWPLEEKIRRADETIWNNEDLHQLKNATRLAWSRVTEA